MASMIGSAVLGAARPLIGQAAEAGGGAVGGALGKAIGGKKGQKIGKSIGKGLAKVGRKIFGFNSGGVVVGGGGKVRVTPVRIRNGYVMGGQVVPAKPKRRRRK